jgi:hypothetical protein
MTKEERMLDSSMVPLQIGDRCDVQWRTGQQSLTAVVVERRPLGHRKRKKQHNSNNNNNSSDHPVWVSPDATQEQTTVPTEPDKFEYYIHYVDHDRYVRGGSWKNF